MQSGAHGQVLLPIMDSFTRSFKHHLSTQNIQQSVSKLSTRNTEMVWTRRQLSSHVCHPIPRSLQSNRTEFSWHMFTHNESYIFQPPLQLDMAM